MSSCAQLLVERIPVAVTERGRLNARVFVRIGIEQASDEAELLHAALELGQRAFDRITRGLRQARDAEEAVRIHLRLAMNDVVTFLGEPVHELRRLFAVHELKRPRRYELDVGAVVM